MKLCFEPYFFDVHEFDFEVELASSNDLIPLDGKCTQNDIALFVGTILAYNDLSFDSKFIDALFKDDEIAISGGIRFQNDQVKIDPSCCCDLGDWLEVIKDVRMKNGVWLGHDPSPIIEYLGNDIIVWSDEKEIPDRKSIKYSISDFEKQVKLLSSDLESFMKLVLSWSKDNFPTEHIRLYNGIGHILKFEKI